MRTLRARRRAGLATLRPYRLFRRFLRAPGRLLAGNLPVAGMLGLTLSEPALTLQLAGERAHAERRIVDHAIGRDGRRRGLLLALRSRPTLAWTGSRLLLERIPLGKRRVVASISRQRCRQIVVDH